MNLQGIAKFCESSDMNSLIGYKYSRDEDEMKTLIRDRKMFNKRVQFTHNPLW